CRERCDHRPHQIRRGRGIRRDRRRHALCIPLVCSIGAAREVGKRTITEEGDIRAECRGSPVAALPGAAGLPAARVRARPLPAPSEEGGAPRRRIDSGWSSEKGPQMHSIIPTRGVVFVTVALLMAAALTPVGARKAEKSKKPKPVPCAGQFVVDPTKAPAIVGAAGFTLDAVVLSPKGVTIDSGGGTAHTTPRRT